MWRGIYKACCPRATRGGGGRHDMLNDVLQVVACIAQVLVFFKDYAQFIVIASDAKINVGWFLEDWRSQVMFAYGIAFAKSKSHIVSLFVVNLIMYVVSVGKDVKEREKAFQKVKRDMEDVVETTAKSLRSKKRRAPPKDDSP